MAELRVVHAGTVPYEEAWARQRELHAQRVAGEVPDTLLLLEHPQVYTAGKRTEPHERPFDGTPVIDVDRGGKITWHGPGQLVGYPIVALPDPVDVVAYVRRLEAALIEVVGAELGGRLRAGRSRNDQIATLVRMYMLDHSRTIARDILRAGSAARAADACARA